MTLKNLLLASMLAPMCCHAQIVINELMQSNIDCIMDDLNEFPDSWVELWNSGSEALNFSGYSLSLESDGSDSYSLPDATVPPGGYLLVYCDKVGDGWHAHFRIDSGKGSLYLFSPDGSVADGVKSIKKQPAPNIAYGRVADGSSSWGYQIIPTPGAQNCGQVSDTVLDAPIFSQEGGVWRSTQTISLELQLPSSAPDGAIIRYTTDGKEPTATVGSTYSDPIKIAASTCVRAKVMADGCISIPSTTNSYIFLGREQKIPLISITTDQDYLYDSQIGIFVEGKGGSADPNYEHDWRRPVNIEYFPVGEEAALNQLCEARVQGGYTRSSSDLKSMAVYANKRFGTKRFEYEFWEKDKPGITDNKSFILRHGGNDFGWAYIRDALCQRMMGRYVDIDWQGYAPVIIFINGQYHAMLALRERSTEDNIYSNYDGLEEIDMIENSSELKEGTWDNYNSFVSFYSESGGHELEEWEQWMDLEEYTDMMILAAWVVNDDFPHNNTVTWRPQAQGGKWRWVLKDFDFGLGIWDTADHKYTRNYFDYLATGSYADATRLYRRLMLCDEYKELFLSRWIAHTGDFLNASAMRELLDEITDENEGELYISDQKWGYSWNTLQGNYDFIRTWIDNRHSYLPTLLKSSFGLGSAASVSVNQSLSDEEAMSINLCYDGVPLATHRFSGKDYVGRTISLSTGQDDNVAGWTVKIGTADEIEYSGSSLQLVIESTRSIQINAIIDANGVASVAADQPSEIRFDAVSGTVHFTTLGSVYDLQGRAIAINSRSASLPSPGCYIAKCGTSTRKIYWQM